MKFSSAALAAAVLIAVASIGTVVATRAAPASVQDANPRYDTSGRLIPPVDYREWVFLSAGFDMSYREGAAAPDMHMFDNVFAPRTAYAAFKKTGVWPDKTVLILENRTGGSHASINKAGHFQMAVVGLEAHVKDVKRFKGGWGFFAFDDKPAEQISYDAACYACHRDHAAADTTFVQFYPTLLPIATARGTISANYLREEGAARR